MADNLPRLKKTILQTLGDVRGKRVLVYGCGNDNAAIWFSKSGAEVDAIDISPKSVDNQKVIAAKLGLRMNAIIMDAHHLDLPSEEYDIVYGNAILHHLMLQEAVPEIVRVLKPEGKAVFRDVRSGNIFLRAFRFATPFWRTPDEHPLARSDFDMLAQRFSTCETTNYILSGLPYFGFARIMNYVILRRMGVKFRLPVREAIYERFDRLDTLLFRRIPSLQRHAWLCLIVLKMPAPWKS
jgi:SAM-dependent methyltransferase